MPIISISLILPGISPTSMVGTPSIVPQLDHAIFDGIGPGNDQGLPLLFGAVAPAEMNGIISTASLGTPLIGKTVVMQGIGTSEVGVPRMGTPDELAMVELSINAVYGSAQGYPGIGDAFESSKYGGALKVRFFKAIRGQGYGIVLDGSSSPLTSTTVNAYETATPATSAGTATTDAEGNYVTDAPSGRDQLQIATEVAGQTPPLTQSLQWHSRTRTRVSFQAVNVGAGYLSSFNRPTGESYALTNLGSGVGIVRYWNGHQDTFQITNQSQKAGSAVWREGAKGGPAAFLIPTSTSDIHLWTSAGAEDVWTDQGIIATGDDVASTYDPTTDMTILISRDSGSGDWTALRSWADGTFTTVGTIVAGTSAGPGGVTIERSAINQLRATIEDGSTRRTFVSPDLGDSWVEE